MPGCFGGCTKVNPHTNFNAEITTNSSRHYCGRAFSEQVEDGNFQIKHRNASSDNLNGEKKQAEKCSNYLDLRQFDLSKLNKVEQEFLENLKLDWDEVLGHYPLDDKNNQKSFLELAEQIDDIREKSIFYKYTDMRLSMLKNKLIQKEMRKLFFEKEKVIL